MFDKERDGFISASELRMIFAALPEKLTEEEIEEMLEAADGDGKDRFLTSLTWLLAVHYDKVKANNFVGE